MTKDELINYLKAHPFVTVRGEDEILKGEGWYITEGHLREAIEHMYEDYAKGPSDHRTVHEGKVKNIINALVALLFDQHPADLLDEGPADDDKGRVQKKKLKNLDKGDKFRLAHPMDVPDSFVVSQRQDADYDYLVNVKFRSSLTEGTLATMMHEDTEVFFEPSSSGEESEFQVGDLVKTNAHGYGYVYDSEPHMVRCITKDGKTETGGRGPLSGWYQFHPDRCEKVGSFEPGEWFFSLLPDECNGSLVVWGDTVLFDPTCFTNPVCYESPQPVCRFFADDRPAKNIRLDHCEPTGIVVSVNELREAFSEEE
jgi:hypothetical protein